MLVLKTRLRGLLADRQLTAAELARRARVPKQTLSRWLAGQAPKDLVQVKRVADALGVSIELLCFGVEAKSAVAVDSKNTELRINELSGVFELTLKRVNS